MSAQEGASIRVNYLTAWQLMVVMGGLVAACGMNEDRFVWLRSRPDARLDGSADQPAGKGASKPKIARSSHSTKPPRPIILFRTVLLTP
jgi:hypothetical protein